MRSDFLMPSTAKRLANFNRFAPDNLYLPGGITAFQGSKETRGRTLQLQGILLHRDRKL